MAGKLIYIAPVDNASGKIFGLKNRFCAVKRQSGERKKGCAFLSERNLIDNPLSAKEKLIRETFTTLTKIVAARIKQDNPRYEADRNLYSQQNKVKAITFKKWLWAQVKANPVVDFVTYGGKACYPGAEPVVLNTTSNNKLSIELVPGMGEKLSGDLQVKVNGTACTSPSLDEDTLTVTLPVSLDGAELGVITVIADSELYRLEY